jgi:anti-sigma regulatory factor (Ser/Thr protein kinase)
MEIRREQIQLLTIDGEADVGVCRRKAVALAGKLGFDEVKSGEIAILMSELATNVLKHGGGRGQVCLCQLTDASDRKAIEIFCCDMGKGIGDFDRALNDGFTEKQSLGIGLGSIRRFSDIFERISTREAGSPLTDFSHLFQHCLRCVKWVPEINWKSSNKQLSTGAASFCKPGETLNGDSYVITHPGPGKTLAAIIDGLGHGKEAHIASGIIKEQVILKSEQPLPELMNYLHQSARGTRGAVIGLAYIDTSRSLLQFSGIGNIEGFIITRDGKKSLISFGGILGHHIRSPRMFEYPFQAGDILCMYSDGITTRWNPDDINWKEHPQRIAENLITNYSRTNDDATVLVICNLG